MSHIAVGPASDAAAPAERLDVRTPGGRIEVTRYRGTSSRYLTIVYLHGGAWIMGSARDNPERLQAIADEGPTVLSIGYRLATEASFPAQQHDIEAVVSALVPSDGPFVLMGASAGAHLAALSALAMTRRPAGFVGLFGRYDLTGAADGILPAPDTVVPEEILRASPPAEYADLSYRERVALLAGVHVSQLSETVMAELSPVFRMTTECPPILALHGTADGLVGPGHSRRLVAAAHSKGVPARLVLVPGANHEDPAFALPAVVATIVEFVRELSARKSEGDPS